jgi:hypothetical protein
METRRDDLHFDLDHFTTNQTAETTEKKEKKKVTNTVAVTRLAL